MARQLERRRNVAPRPFWAAARGRSDISGALPGRKLDMIVALSLSKGEAELRAGRANMSSRSFNYTVPIHFSACKPRRGGPTGAPLPAAAIEPAASRSRYQRPAAAARWPRFSVGLEAARPT